MFFLFVRSVLLLLATKTLQDQIYAQCPTYKFHVFSSFPFCSFASGYKNTAKTNLYPVLKV